MCNKLMEAGSDSRSLMPLETWAARAIHWTDQRVHSFSLWGNLQRENLVREDREII